MLGTTEDMNGEKIPAEVWPEYQDCRVGIKLGGLPEKTITPAKARELADSIEDDCIDDLMDPGLEVREFVDDLRRLADDVEEET